MPQRAIGIWIGDEDYRYLISGAESLNFSLSSYARLLIRIGEHNLSKDPSLLDRFDEVIIRQKKGT